MHSATKVLAFNGVEVGELVEADEDVVRFRNQEGRVVTISAQAVFQHRGGVLRLICYGTGVHRWEVEESRAGRERGGPGGHSSPPGSRPG